VARSVKVMGWPPSARMSKIRVAGRRHLVDEVQCGSDEPAAAERPTGRDGEFGFVFTVLGRVTAVVGGCEVSVYTRPRLRQPG
jgi:hypothetical protein